MTYLGEHLLILQQDSHSPPFIVTNDAVEAVRKDGISCQHSKVV